MKKVLSIFVFLILMANIAFSAQVQDDIGILSARDKEKIENINVPFDLLVLVTNFTTAGFENYFHNRGIVGIGVNPISKITTVVSPTGVDVKGLAKLGNKDFSKLRYGDGVSAIANEYEKRLRKEIMHNEMSQEAVVSLTVVGIGLLLGLLSLILYAARKRRNKELEKEQEKLVDEIIVKEFSNPKGRVSVFQFNQTNKENNFEKPVPTIPTVIETKKPEPVVYHNTPSVFTVTPPARETTMSPMATLAMSAVGGFSGSMLGRAISNNFLNKPEPTKVEEDITTPNLVITEKEVYTEVSTETTSNETGQDSSSWTSSDTSSYSSTFSTDSSSSSSDSSDYSSSSSSTSDSSSW